LSLNGYRSILSHAGAQITHSEAEFVAYLQRYKRPVEDVSYKDKTKQSSSIRGIQIGSLTISEFKTDSIVTKTIVEPHISFMLIIAGSGAFNSNGTAIDWSTSRHIYSFSYNYTMLNEFNDTHAIAIRPSIDGLTKMFELRNPAYSVALESVRENRINVYEPHYEGVHFRNQIDALLSVISDGDGDEAFLERIGVDDVLNSVLAELIIAQAGHSPDTAKQNHLPRSARAVDLICEYIRNNVGRPLTMSKMEELSNLTGRTLNYAFQQRFSCSPQEWQRAFLLDEAHKRLSLRDPLFSIKSLAYELGFSSANSFAAHYKRRFGELPSETASRSALPSSANKIDDGE